MKPSLEHFESARGAGSISARAFAELYGSHLSQVKAFLARNGCQAHSLDDLAQETFLRAWNGRDSFSGECGLQTWILGIARNTAREFWRKDIIPLPLKQESCRDPHDSIVQIERADAVRLAVSQLPAKQQLAITLVYLDGLTQSDAANKASCAEAAFRRRLMYGRRRLRQLLEQRSG